MVVWNIVYFQPETLGKWSNLTSIFFKWVGSTTNQFFDTARPKRCYTTTMVRIFWCFWMAPRVYLGNYFLATKGLQNAGVDAKIFPAMGENWWFEGIDMGSNWGNAGTSGWGTKYLCAYFQGQAFRDVPMSSEAAFCQNLRYLRSKARLQFDRQLLQAERYVHVSSWVYSQGLKTT